MPTDPIVESNIQVGLTPSKTRAFGALRKRNVQLYMVGMLVSQMGNTMQALAEAWLVYQLTNSPFKLGLVGFVAALPLAPWSVLAGAISDRVSRRELLAIALVGETIPPLVLAALVLMGRAQVWHVIVASILLGALDAVDFSSRMPLIQSMVEPDELERGFALSVSLMSVARILGPAVGGTLIAIIGVAGAFTFNGLSFLFVLVMLALMHIPKHAQATHRESLAANLVEAPMFILRDRLILIFIVMVMLGGFFILPTLTLLPVFARDILGVGPQGLGFLSAASGVGAVLGGAFLASRSSMSLRRRLVLEIGLLFVLAPITIAFAFSRNFVLSALLIVLVTGSFVVFRVTSFTYIYLHTPDRMRGRISSILQLGILSSQNVGGLVSGYIASRASATASVTLGGVMSLLLGITVLGVVFPQLGALKSKRDEASTASDMVQRAIE